MRDWTIRYKRNACEHTLTVRTETGEQIYDLSVLNRIQLDAVVELVVRHVTPWLRS